MHPINWLLSYFGVQIYKSKRQAGFPAEFRKSYIADLKALQKSPPPGFTVYPEMIYEKGAHPENSVDYECEFAAFHLQRLKPQMVLDVGSYRQFIIGLLANREITTVDVRTRKPMLASEHAITADAKAMPLKEQTFDAAVSLCTLEHLGLGRYGDPQDINADDKTLAEITRVLKKGGSLIITTEIKKGVAAIAFNAHRVYNLELLYKKIKSSGLVPEDERFFSRKLNRECTFEELTDAPKGRDVYLGCWKKI